MTEVVFDPYQLADHIYRKLVGIVRYDPIQQWAVATDQKVPKWFTPLPESRLDKRIYDEIDYLHRDIWDNKVNRGAAGTYEAINEIRNITSTRAVRDELHSLVKRSIAYPYPLYGLPSYRYDVTHPGPVTYRGF